MTLPAQTSAEIAADNRGAADQLAMEDLLGIVNDVWSSYLNAEGELLPAMGAGPAERVMGTVSVAGGWSGHIVVSLSSAAARRATAELLAMSDDEVSSDDVCDAVGELANVVGGNVKSLLPGPSSLSLPIVNEMSAGGRLHLPEAVESLRADLVWRNEPVTVSVWTAAE